MGTVISNPEYFSTSTNIDLTQNVAINKEIIVTNTSTSSAVVITLSDTQTHNLPADETVALFYNGTSFIVFNEIGVDETLQTHINSTTDATTVHGINQGLTTTSTPKFNDLTLAQATGSSPSLTFEEGTSDRFIIQFDEPNDNLNIHARNDDGSARDTPVQIPRADNAEIVFDRPIQCTSIDTGDGNFEIGQNLRVSDSSQFVGINVNNNTASQTVDPYITLEENGSDRFNIYYDVSASTLKIDRYDNSGTLVETALELERDSNGDLTLLGNLNVTNINTGTGDFKVGQSVLTTSDVSFNEVAINSATGEDAELLLRENSVTRGKLIFDSSADTYNLITYQDDGTTVRDTPITIPRTNDAEITIDRPVQINGDLDLQTNDITSGTFQGANKVTAISSSPTDSELPTAQAVQEYVTAATGMTVQGDSIPTGSKLISDGTPVVYTSDFDYPVRPNVTFIPSTIEVDDQYYNNTNNVKFPGQRWMKGVFYEYENIIDNTLLPTAGSSCSVSFEEEWIRVEATAATTNNDNSAASYSFTDFTTNGTCSMLIKRGGSTASSQVIIRDSTTTRFNIEIAWIAKTISYHDSTVNVNKSFFLSDDIVFISGLGAGTGSDTIYLYSEDYASASSGAYSFYKNIQVVDDIYPFPYTVGTHEQDNLAYDLTWGSTGTIEFWADVQFNYDTAIDIVLFDNRLGDSSSTNAFYLYFNSATDKLMITFGNTAGTAFNFATDAYTSGTWLTRGFHHFKITYDTANTTNVQLRIDGGSDLITTRPTYSGTFSLNNRLYIGRGNYSMPPASYFNGAIDDILWQPTVDTTNTHYTGGNPYIVLNKTYGANGNYTVDQQGNIVASSFRDNEDLNFLDPLSEGDVLFFDGTISSNDSRGSKPIQGFERFYFTPATLVIDDELYNNPFAKFPGLRGIEGVFENFPNQISQNYQEWTGFGGASRKGEGNWIVIENNGTATDYVSSNAITASGAFQTLWRMIIKNVDATTTNVNFSGIGDINITWGSSRSVSYTSPTEDLNTQFISDNIIAIVVTHDATGASPHIRITSDPNNANRTVKVKEILSVNFGDATPWEFPFFEQERPTDQISYYLDWGQQGTLEFWANVNFNYNTPSDHFLFDNRTGDSSNIGAIIFFYQGSTNEFVLQLHDIAGERDEFKTTAYTSGTWIGRGWTHFKITYSTTVQSNNAMYIDGSADLLTVKGTLDGTYSFNPRINIGHAYFSNVDGQWNGYITDFKWSPTLDTSNTHYYAGMPYYIPSKTYSKDGSYSRDKYGNLTVTDIEGVNIPGEFEIIWEGNDGAPDIYLESGFYLMQFSETNATNANELISAFIRFDRSANVLHRATCYTTTGGSIIPQITNEGAPTLDNTGSSFPNRRLRRIWRLKQ